jgi:hypothetical protein
MSHAGFNPEKQKLRDIGFIHYIVHWLYSFLEPKVILKLNDYLLAKKWVTETRWGKKIMLYIAKASRDLPHGVVKTKGLWKTAQAKLRDYYNTTV